MSGEPRVDPTLLVEAMAAAGAVDGRARLVSLTEAPLGIGALADTVRLTLTWAEPGSGPATAVVKLPALDDNARTTANSLGAYEREVRFYQDLAPHLDIRVPRCLGIVEVDGSPTGVVLEDLSASHHPGNQLADLAPGTLRVARQQLSALQAPFWDDPATASLPWLHKRLGVPIPGIHERMQRSWAGAGGDLCAGFPADEIEAIDRFVARADTWALGIDGPFSLTHHDFRVDNMLFGDDPSDLVVLDFQTLGWGAPMFDVAYLLGTSMAAEVRRSLEREEIARHCDELAAYGVTLAFDDAWERYRRASFAVLLMLVPPTGSVKTSPRHEAMYRRLLSQGARQVLDLDALDLLDA